MHKEEGRGIILELSYERRILVFLCVAWIPVTANWKIPMEEGPIHTSAGA